MVAPSETRQEVAVKRGFISIPMGKIHYQMAGSGKPLILIHPSPFDSKRYLPLLPTLGAHRKVFAIDSPGYGMSYRSEQQPTMDDHADTVAEAVEALGYEKAPLYGDLSGAIIVLATAARRPERVSAVPLGIIPYVAQHQEEAEAWRRIYDIDLFRGRNPAPHPPELVTEWIIDRMQMHESAIWGFEATSNCDIDEGVRGISYPILIAATEAHGNQVQIARAKTVLPRYEIRQGLDSWAIEDTRDFLTEAIPSFLDSHGV